MKTYILLDSHVKNLINSLAVTEKPEEKSSYILGFIDSLVITNQMTEENSDYYKILIFRAVNERNLPLLF